MKGQNTHFTAGRDKEVSLKASKSSGEEEGKKPGESQVKEV